MLIQNNPLRILKINFYTFFSYLILWYLEFFIILKIQNIILGTKSLYFPMLIFLPHGCRVIFSMIYGLKAFPGLLMAHVLTGLYFINDMTLIIQLSLASVLSVYLSIFFVCKKVNLLEENIQLKSILLVAVLSSIFNSFLNLFLKGMDHISMINLLSYAVGDIFGTLLVFWFILFFIKKNKLLI